MNVGSFCDPCSLCTGNGETKAEIMSERSNVPITHGAGLGFPIDRIYPMLIYSIDFMQTATRHETLESESF